jgi:hypothetical protein
MTPAPTPSPPFDALPFAGINATVLSVLVAGVLIWVSMQWYAIRDLAADAFITAARAMAPSADTLDASIGESGEGYATDTPEERDALAKRLFGIVQGNQQAAGLSPSDRGREALVILSAVVTSRPYYGIQWKSVKDLRDWVREVQESEFGAMWWLVVEGPYLDVLVRAYDDSWSGGTQTTDAPRMFAGALVSLREKVRRVIQASTEVGFALDQREAHLSRLPRKSILLSATVLVAAVFSVGVILPLFDPHASVWLVAYVPAAFYSAVLVLCIVVVAGLRLKRETDHEPAST